jgi:hypothetical protein
MLTWRTGAVNAPRAKKVECNGEAQHRRPATHSTRGGNAATPRDGSLGIGKNALASGASGRSRHARRRDPGCGKTQTVTCLATVLLNDLPRPALLSPDYFSA